jgi:hypothetical protein
VASPETVKSFQQNWKAFRINPPRKDFYNKLKQSMPSEDEYNKAVDIWEIKGFKTFEEYMMYYCECDVDLLMEG